MISTKALELQKNINNLQEKSDKQNKKLKNIITKYIYDGITLEEIAFLHNIVSTKAVSYLCFNLRFLAYEIDEKKTSVLFNRSIEELMEHKPVNFPLKEVEKLTRQIDDINHILKKNKKEFWSKYCLNVLRAKNMNEISNFSNCLEGNGMRYLIQVMISAHNYLEDNKELEYENLLESEVIV